MRGPRTAPPCAPAAPRGLFLSLGKLPVFMARRVGVCERAAVVSRLPARDNERGGHHFPFPLLERDVSFHVFVFFISF